MVEVIPGVSIGVSINLKEPNDPGICLCRTKAHIGPRTYPTGHEFQNVSSFRQESHRILDLGHHCLVEVGSVLTGLTVPYPGKIKAKRQITRSSQAPREGDMNP
jgi:hypothetical protein